MLLKRSIILLIAFLIAVISIYCYLNFSFKPLFKDTNDEPFNTFRKGRAKVLKFRFEEYVKNGEIKGE